MYVRLIARSKTHYDAGTEVFNYDGERYTEDEWKECLVSGTCGTRGFRKNKEGIDKSLCKEFNCILTKDNAYFKIKA